MDQNLFCIDKAPRALPVWDAIMDDLCNPPAHRVAKALGVGRSTVYRWNAEGQGPRIACMALFWLTRWGRSLVDSQATNDAILYVQMARSLGEERDKLARELDTLDRDYRTMAVDLATMRLASPERGNAAIADHSHTGRSPVGSSEPARLADPDSLAWPGLDWSAAPGQPGNPGDLLEHAKRVSNERPGSHAAPPPGAHSTRCPEPTRTGRPQPSTHPEFAQLSPSNEVSYHGDAIMTSPFPAPCDLLEVRQAQRLTALKGPSSGGEQFVDRSKDLSPALDLGCTAGGAPPPGALRASGRSPASLPLWTSRQPEQPLSWRAGATCGAPPDAPADGPPQFVQRAGLDLARPGTPGSAARPERPASLGQAPDPAPRAPGAPPGLGAFAAIVTAATRNAPTLRGTP